jgi:chromosome segregation ATPase
MSWKDRIHDALYEEQAPTAPEPIHQQPAQPLPTFQPLADSVMPSGAAPASVLSSGVSSILSDLRDKTNFDATPIGQQLKGCMDALADTGLSEEQKIKTAMKLSHQVPSQVVSVLQGLQSVLVTDKQHFEATMQTATTAEVNARQAKSAQLQSSIDAAEAQITAMRQEKSQVDVELRQKQDKISSARANYTAASEALNTELAEMISHYQSIPEVN